jgi:hypothetical protein
MKQLINPFERIAGWQALVIGVAVMALTAVVGQINHVAFDGALDVHVGATFSLSASFAMQAIDFLALFLTMWLAGVCFSKTKPRAIDIAGTMALARVPMLLLAIVCFLPIAPANLSDIPRIIVFMIVYLFFAIWMIALMYNAYSVSCHLKGTRAVISFIGALLVAEIVSKLVLIFFLSSLFINSPASGASGTNSTENIVAVDDSLTIRQKTENVVKAFEQGDFDAITVYFDETMKKGLPPSGLKMAWVQVNTAYGKFEKADMDNLKEAQADNYDIVEVPFHFQKETLKLRLAFNKDGTIGGLYIQP